MKLWTSPAAFSILALLLVAACDGPDAYREVRHLEPEFTAEEARLRFWALRPALEEALGEPFGASPQFTYASEDELAGHIAASRGDDSDIRWAVPQAMAVLAMTEFTSGCVLLSHGGFIRQAAVPGRDAILTRGFLDVVLIHEAIHVRQGRRFNTSTFLPCGAVDIDEASARTALIEGHAQFLTRRAAEAAGLSEQLDLLVAMVSSPPPEREGMAVPFAFAYADGERWFTALADKLGFEEAERRAFTSPPRTRREIEHPGDYLLRTNDTAGQSD